MEPMIITAIQKGLFQQVRFLVEFGLEVNERDGEGRTPLMALALVDDQAWGLGMAHLLLENGAHVGHRDKRGLNALHYACVYERPELVKVYLGAIDYSLNQGDRLGNTALHVAVTTGNLTVTRLLLNTLHRYKMSADRPNKSGVTPLIQAWKAGQVECALLLKQKGSPDINKRDLVEGRSAQEWEEAVVAGMERERTTRRPSSGAWATRGRPNTASFVGGPRIEVHRPSSSVGHFDGHSISSSRGSSILSLDSVGQSESKPLPSYMRPKTATRRERKPSTPLLSKRRKSYPQNKVQQDNSGKENHLVVSEDIVTRDQLSKNTIHNDEASLRNKPEYVFQVTPLEYFNKEHNVHTPGAAKHVNFPKRAELNMLNPGDWRGEIKTLYKAFEFQFTDSFRKTAKQPEPERPPSPSPSECVSEAVSSSDRTSQHSRQRTRRSSVMKQTQKEERQRKNAVGGKGNHRKASILTPSNLRASLQSVDSSSTESVNSNHKPKRLSTNSLDHRDDLSDVSSHSERPAKSPGRGGEGRPARASAHGPIPVVKEPKAMKSIRE